MLSIGDVIVSSWRDSRRVVGTYKTPLYICLVLAAIGGLFKLGDRYMTSAGDAGSPYMGAFGMIYASAFLMVILSFFSLAAAVRTVRPEFRLTIGRFFMVLLYSLVVGLATEIAAFFLLIPGFWVGVKLSLVVPMYCLYTDDALGRSWNATTHRYWSTFGLLILSGLITGCLAWIAFGLGVLLIAWLAVVGFIVVPLVLLALVFLVQFHWLALVRWSQNLVEHPAEVSVTVAPA